MQICAVAIGRPYGYGPPAIEFAEADVDQARAAGVLLELDHRPLIVDRALYRELAKAAIARTVDELRARAAAQAELKAKKRQNGRCERTPVDELEAEHRAQGREFADRARGVNLDLGRALLTELASVDPADTQVARFYCFGLLGPDTPNYLGSGDHIARTNAANGLRLVLEQHRTSETPTRKDGTPGKTKVSYAEPGQALAWLWRFVDGAKTAGALYGRVLVVFAAQRYALKIALPRSQRRGPVLPRSRKDEARKAFEKIAKRVLPASYRELVRAIERAARDHDKRLLELQTRTRKAAEAERPVDTVELRLRTHRVMRSWLRDPSRPTTSRITGPG